MEAFNAAMEGTRTILAQVEKPGGTMYSPERCAELGYDVALFGLTLLSGAAAGVERTLSVMGAGDHPTAVQGNKPMESGAGLLLPFDDLYDAVGFNEHYDLEDAFDSDKFACAEGPDAAECEADFDSQDSESDSFDGSDDISDASVEANWTDEVNSVYASDTDDRAARDDQYKKFYDQIGLKNGGGGGFFGDQ